MEELVKRLLASDLKDLEGLKISGLIPVSERLVNELAAEYLRDFFSAAPENAPAPAGDRPDFAAVLRRLQLQRFEVQFEQGKMVVQLDIGR